MRNEKSPACYRPGFSQRGGFLHEQEAILIYQKDFSVSIKKTRGARIFRSYSLLPNGTAHTERIGKTLLAFWSNVNFVLVFYIIEKLLCCVNNILYGHSSCHRPVIHNGGDFHVVKLPAHLGYLADDLFVCHPHHNHLSLVTKQNVSMSTSAVWHHLIRLLSHPSSSLSSFGKKKKIGTLNVHGFLDCLHANTGMV